MRILFLILFLFVTILPAAVLAVENGRAPAVEPIIYLEPDPNNGVQPTATIPYHHREMAETEASGFFAKLVYGLTLFLGLPFFLWFMFKQTITENTSVLKDDLDAYDEENSDLSNVVQFKRRDVSKTEEASKQDEKEHKKAS